MNAAGIFPSMVLPSPLVTTTIGAVNTHVGVVKATISIKRDGSITTTVSGTSSTTATNVPTAWARLTSLTNLGDVYHVRFFSLSGVTSIFDTSDTWLALSSDREFGTQRSTLGASTGSSLVQISSDGGTNIRQSFEVDYSVSVAAP